ncbi:MAG: hypothetical protein AAGF77_11325 [Bacteroidota bacterium]
MKAIITLCTVLFFAITAMAQVEKQEVKVVTTTVDVVLDITIEKMQTNTTIARVYRFKNSKIKKALSFTIKNQRAKMA